MSYGVVRIQKIKVSDGGGLSKRYDHAFRKHISPNIDRERVQLDEYHGPETRADFFSAIRARQSLATSRRSDNVGLLEVLATTTDGLPQGSENDWINDCVTRLKKMYGEENLIGYAVHRDEKETHVHAFVVPLITKKVEKTRLTKDEEERLQAACRTHGIQFQRPPKKPEKGCTDQNVWNTYKAAQKSFETFKKAAKSLLAEIGAVKTETVLDAQLFCANRERMSAFQDWWYEFVSKKYGLERGDQGRSKTYSPTNLHRWHQNLKTTENTLSERDRSLSERSERLDRQELSLAAREAEIERKHNLLKENVRQTNVNRLKFAAAAQRYNVKEMIEAGEAAISGLTAINQSRANHIQALEEELRDVKKTLQDWRNRSPEDLEDFADYLRENNAANAQELIDRENAPKKSQNHGRGR